MDARAVAGIALALASLSAAADDIFVRDKFRIMNIMPCMRGREEVVAKDAVEYAERTGNAYVLYSLTLHPQGFPAMKTVDAAVESYRRFASLVAGTKVRPAILLQAIIGHWTSDLAEKEAEPWQRAINVKGVVTRFCPLDPRYRDYIRTVGRKLAECHPAFILGDDDIRAFSPDAECFCPLHTAAFNRRTGRSLAPEQYRALIASADYRSSEHKAFTDLQRDTVVGVCKAIREGIDDVDPSIPAGVCEPGWVWSSAQIVDHARGIAAKGQIPFLRLANGIYTEGAPKAEIALRTLCTMAKIGRHRPAGVLMMDEADTFPHNLFSKSSVAFHGKLVVGAFLGLNGAKAWHVNGHRADLPISRHYTDVLAAHRGLYDAVAASVLGATQTGVLVPCHPEFPTESAANRKGVRSYDQKGWGDLVFGNFGIPFQATYDFDADGVYALSGAAAVDRFSDDQLRRMLAKKALVDGHAAEALVRRGLGDLLGVEIPSERPLVTGDYDEMNARAMPYPKRVQPTIFRADASAKVLSWLVWRESAVALDFERVCPSGVLYRNAAGGRVATVAMHGDMSGTYMYTEARKEYVLSVLAALAGAPVENVCGNAQNVLALSRRDAVGRDLVLYQNLNYDPERGVLIRRAAKPSAVEEMDAHGVWRAVSFGYDGREVSAPGDWACYGTRIFRITK